jgi:hypothetical protein
MNAAGDYSSAYCILHTDSEFKGHGMVTIPLPLPPASSIQSSPPTNPVPL